MNKTVTALLESIGESTRIREKIEVNMNTGKDTTMVLNLVELHFKFESSIIQILYYAVDDNYPDVELTFSDLREVLQH